MDVFSEQPQTLSQCTEQKICFNPGLLRGSPHSWKLLSCREWRFAADWTAMLIDRWERFKVTTKWHECMPPLEYQLPTCSFAISTSNDAMAVGAEPGSTASTVRFQLPLRWLSRQSNTTTLAPSTSPSITFQTPLGG